MKKKPIAALIMAEMKKSKSGDDSEEDYDMEDDEESDYDEGLLASSEEVIGAIESGDAEGLAMALKAFVEQCS